MPERKRSRNALGEMGRVPMELTARGEGRPTLEIVLKCDAMGSVEAVSALLANLKLIEAQIKVIHAGVGNISKQDLMMALTGSRLAVGFNVGVSSKLEQWVKEHGVEVRLYDVIYKLADDLKAIAENMVPVEAEEKVTGKCEVIATFKSKKGGVILGCEVVEGAVQVGKSFRVVAAMGPVHSGRIESLQVEKQPVKEARTGQQVGVQVSGSTQGKVGDFIECFDLTSPKKAAWTPRGKIVRM